MELHIGVEAIFSYKRLPYTAWSALAEFIDNSTQSYLSNKNILDEIYKNECSSCEIIIEQTGINPVDSILVISDNCLGMDYGELQSAMSIGKFPQSLNSRSVYGLGLKTSASWFGDKWEVITKKYGANKEYRVVFDLNLIIQNQEPLLELFETDKALEEHYTIIRIFNNNHIIKGRTYAKIRDYLSSIFRRDFEKKLYNLKVFGNDLIWDYETEIFDRIKNNIKGEKLKREIYIEFPENEQGQEKYIDGWVAVLDPGSRKLGGFTILVNDRVIEGYPKQYKPEDIYGIERNDLINQRLTGEFNAFGFNISHTKDKVLFSDDDITIIEEYLNQNIRDYIVECGKNKRIDPVNLDEQNNAISAAVDYLQNEFERSLKKINLFDAECKPPAEIVLDNKKVFDNFIKKNDLPPVITLIHKDLKVEIFLDSLSSPNDMYVNNQATGSRERLIIVINTNHSFWNQIESTEEYISYIRECAFDGIAEWKSTFIEKQPLEYNTILKIKNNLLNLPFEIKIENLKS